MNDKTWRLYNASTQRQIVDLDIEAARQLYARLAPPERPHWFAWQNGWLDWLRITDVPELQVAPAQAAAPRATPPPFPTFTAPAPAPTAVAAEAATASTTPFAKGSTRITASGVTITAVTDPTLAETAAEAADSQMAADLGFGEESPSGTVVQGLTALAGHTAAPPVARPPVAPPPTAKAPRPAPPAKPPVAESFTERRKHPRAELKLKVIIEVAGRAFRTFSKDVSLGGLQLQDRLPWDLQDDACKVYVSSPDGRDSIEFKSRIVVDLKNPKRVQFVDASPAYTAKLDAWIAAHGKKSRKAA